MGNLHSLFTQLAVNLISAFTSQIRCYNFLSYRWVDRCEDHSYHLATLSYKVIIYGSLPPRPNDKYLANAFFDGLKEKIFNRNANYITLCLRLSIFQLSFPNI